MSRREQYLKAYHNRPFERLTWAPNFDHWLGVNKANGTLPAEFRGMSRNDIVRAVGGTIWSRVHSVHADNDLPRERRDMGDGRWVDVVHTPKGDLSYTYITQGGADRAVVLAEHPVKSVDDLLSLLELMAATKFKVDTARATEELKAVGEDGIVLEPCPCVPFIQFGKMEAGWEAGLLMWYDHRAEVEAALEAIEARHLEEIRLTAVNSPALVVHLGDNMDQLMVSPDLFRRYALPFYAKAAKIVHAAGKLLSVHWCGRTGALLPMLPGSGVDIVEAVVTRPMSDLTIERALESLRGEVVLQGCLPAVLMCPQGGTRDDLARYVRHIVDEVHPTRGFVLGMGDNVPPDADFGRVRLVSEIVKAAYG